MISINFDIIRSNIKMETNFSIILLPMLRQSFSQNTRNKHNGMTSFQIANKTIKSKTALITWEVVVSILWHRKDILLIDLIPRLLAISLSPIVVCFTVFNAPYRTNAIECCSETSPLFMIMFIHTLLQKQFYYFIVLYRMFFSIHHTVLTWLPVTSKYSLS